MTWWSQEFEDRCIDLKVDMPKPETHGIMMKSEEDWKVIENMRKFGGSFVNSLGDCFLRADATNYAKLRKTFPEYWNEYRDIGEKK